MKSEFKSALNSYIAKHTKVTRSKFVEKIYIFLAVTSNVTLIQKQPIKYKENTKKYLPHTSID